MTITIVVTGGTGTLNINCFFEQDDNQSMTHIIYIYIYLLKYSLGFQIKIDVCYSLFNGVKPIYQTSTQIALEVQEASGLKMLNKGKSCLLKTKSVKIWQNMNSSC